MNFSIRYGSNEISKNVTNIVLKKCLKDNIIFIPDNDYCRASYFGDPCVGILKSIFIDYNNTTLTYDDTKYIFIDLKSNLICDSTQNIPEYIIKIYPNIDEYRYKKLRSVLSDSDASEKLLKIHNKIKILGGSFNEEFPEQIMVAKVLSGNENVLEIGANIGRNTLVIADMLREKGNDINFLSFECDINSYNILKNNRDINHFNFNIENSALSARRLIQKGWDTIPSDTLIDGYTEVNTITFNEIKIKYDINFDTLVLDCEGAFYYILKDMPNILDNINLIIVENDYCDLSHKEYVDDILRYNDFSIIYSKSGGGGSCMSRFYEIWSK
jgi:FkbM family methyltransferase